MLLLTELLGTYVQLVVIEGLYLKELAKNEGKRLVQIGLGHAELIGHGHVVRVVALLELVRHLPHDQTNSGLGVPGHVDFVHDFPLRVALVGQSPAEIVIH